MEHLHYQVSANAGDVIRVEINQQANVLLLDPVNYINYCQGGSFRYHGGLQKVSPVRLSVPYSANWHIAVDLGGRSGYLTASVQVLS